MAERLPGVGQGRLKKTKTPEVADVKKILEESSSTLNMSRIAQIMLAEFGGVERLGREMRKEFDQAKAGSTVRNNTIKSIMSMVNQAAPQHHVSDLTNLSDEDLERTLKSILSKLIVEGEVPRGPEEAVPPAQ